MVQALAPNRANDPFHIGSLPGRARGRQHFFDVHVSHPFSEVPAKDAVAVAQQVARDMVKGEGFSQLLTRPLSGWMATHVEVKNAPTIMSQDQKHVEYLETDGGDREEINGDDLQEVVLEESAPGLRRRFTAADHVLGDTALADVDAELEQFAMNARCTPGGILPAHPADQVPNLARNRRPSRLSVPYLPSPKQAEAFAMPENDRSASPRTARTGVLTRLAGQGSSPRRDGGRAIQIKIGITSQT